MEGATGDRRQVHPRAGDRARRRRRGPPRPRRGAGSHGRHQAHGPPARHDRGRRRSRPARGAPGRRHQPPARGVDPRPGQGRGLLLARHGARRGTHARRGHRGRGAAAPSARGRHHRPGRRALVEAEQGRDRAPRRQAEQHHGRRRRPREARRLRHRPVGQRRGTDEDRAGHRLPRLHRPRGRVRVAGDRGERRVVARRHALPRARRPGAARRRARTSWAASTGSSTTTLRACPTTTRWPGCWPR